MWDAGDDETVTCIACGESVPRSAAREYDKQGDRWSRADKAFEHLCKPCHGRLCHQPRGELEALLSEIDTNAVSRERFLERYVELVDRERERPDTRE
jgi:hypothetical protein